ncbi:MAG: S8 family serine peptidase [Streptosporangiaceae bacterium]
MSRIGAAALAGLAAAALAVPALGVVPVAAPAHATAAQVTAPGRVTAGRGSTRRAAAAYQVTAAWRTAAGKPRPSRSARPVTRRSSPPAHPPATRHPAPGPVTVLPRPTSGCPATAASTRHVRSLPWAQRVLDFASVWPLAEGRGITVAVVDSGVDYSPQLAGRVTAVDLTGSGPQDCVGHGTAVAAIIAASARGPGGSQFAGVAPQARILSVKVNSGKTGRASRLAAGIREAAARGAQVINVSVTTRTNAPVLYDAVRYALRRGAVIVAAGGNDELSAQGKVSRGPFYPASYPGVLSVGAVGSDGTLAPFSDMHSEVGVTAPGEDITSAWPGGYETGLAGTSFATPFVSGVAALVRSRYPGLTAAQVVGRIEGTADGGNGPGTGAGLVNPVQAVTAVLPWTGPTAAAAPGSPVPVGGPPAPDRPARVTALALTAGCLAAAAMIVVGVPVLGAARRRRRAARGLAGQRS